jgi:hypothetical protein
MNIEDIHYFKENGYVIITDVFDDIEVENMRNNLHKTLLENYNHDHDKVLAGYIKPASDVRIKSKLSNIFYKEFKLESFLNKKVYDLYKSLMDNTFASGNTPDFEHPLGSSNDILPYIDRICYRLPDHIRSEGGLGLHIDRNPLEPYNQKKFRPIQSFISLVDHNNNESGGLQLIPRFHKEYNNYFYKNHLNISISGENIEGEFHRLNSHVHERLHKRVETLIVPKGSIVFWDNRLPHKTCEKLTSYDTREVIYFSYIPNVEINKKYFICQYNNIVKNINPPAYNDNNESADRDWSINFLEKSYIKKLTF